MCNYKILAYSTRFVGLIVGETEDYFKSFDNVYRFERILSKRS